MSAGIDRYARHTVLPEVGPGGQDRLRRSTVLVVGTLQATQALKLLIGAGELSPRPVTVDVRTHELASYEVRRDPGCPVCGEGDADAVGTDR